MYLIFLNSWQCTSTYFVLWIEMLIARMVDFLWRDSVYSLQILMQYFVRCKWGYSSGFSPSVKTNNFSGRPIFIDTTQHTLHILKFSDGMKAIFRKKKVKIYVYNPMRHFVTVEYWQLAVFINRTDGCVALNKQYHIVIECVDMNLYYFCVANF